MKTISAFLLFSVSAFLFSGCKTGSPTLSPALVQSGVAAGVGYGVTKYPTAIPAVKAGLEVVCSAANGTNLSPAVVIAGIQSNPEWTAVQTPEATFIMNGALTIYSGVWNSYGAEAVNNSPLFKEYLQAVCNGGREGIAGRPAPRAASDWPQLHFK